MRILKIKTTIKVKQADLRTITQVFVEVKRNNLGTHFKTTKI